MLPPLINALKNPACYPHSVSETIDIIETQVSWVVLTGDYVYKVKKELDFGFLDFSTLQKRQFYCEEELRLNQRLAPDIYQAVVTISGNNLQPTVGEYDYRSQYQHFAEASASTAIPAQDLESNTSPILEYAVRMQQFEPQAGLDQLLRRNQFKPQWIDQLAEQLAQFHLCLPTVTANSPWGKPENIWQLVKDNFEHTLNFNQEPEIQSKLQHLYDQASQAYLDLSDVLDDRRRQGFIRECHGDLHLANITCYQDQLRLFDCIEFNLEFRWIDTCSDLAFLLMDLEANGKYSWANLALNRYLEVTGDYQTLALLNFYKSFRSMVRAKVATLGEQASRDTFVKYLNLTRHYQQAQQPKLILMHGLSGSGKSYISSKIIQASSTIRLRSEVERNRIHKELQKKGKSLALHSPEINARLSQHLLDLTEQILSLGYTVIVDGTFLKQHFRQKYFDIAEKQSLQVTIISCQCHDKLMEARLVKGINTRTNDSQFSLDRLYTQRSYQQPLSEKEKKFQQIVDTDSDLSIARLIDQFKTFDS